MSGGTPSTPAEIATARALMAEVRGELGSLVGAGVSGLAPSLASVLVGEALLGADTASGDVTIAAVEQPGSDLIFITASRGGVPFAAIAMPPAEALGVSTRIVEILNRRSASKR
jgi:hypothetical protein